MRDIVLQIHRMHKLYNKVHLKAFWAKHANLVLLVPQSGIALTTRWT